MWDSVYIAQSLGSDVVPSVKPILKKLDIKIRKKKQFLVFFLINKRIRTFRRHGGNKFVYSA